MAGRLIKVAAEFLDAMADTAEAAWRTITAEYADPALPGDAAGSAGGPNGLKQNGSPKDNGERAENKDNGEDPGPARER